MTFSDVVEEMPHYVEYARGWTLDGCSPIASKFARYIRKSSFDESAGLTLEVDLEVETGNYMSTGFESHATDSLRLIESSIFARIPFDDSSFTETHEVVSFEDSGGDMYQSFLSRNSIDTLDIRVTDARGRSLSQRILALPILHIRQILHTLHAV